MGRKTKTLPTLADAGRICPQRASAAMATGGSVCYSEGSKYKELDPRLADEAPLAYAAQLAEDAASSQDMENTKQEHSEQETPQILDAAPRGGANIEVMCALATGKKGTVSFFKGDEAGTPIGAHKVFDFNGENQDVGMVQTWNQANEMLLTSQSKRQSVILMDTETGTTKSELSLRRGRRGCDLNVESITPMQKFEQYKPSQEYKLFGIGDEGKTVFGMNHDSRMGQDQDEVYLQRNEIIALVNTLYKF